MNKFETAEEDSLWEENGRLLMWGGDAIGFGPKVEGLPSVYERLKPIKDSPYKKIIMSWPNGFYVGFPQRVRMDTLDKFKDFRQQLYQIDDPKSPVGGIDFHRGISSVFSNIFKLNPVKIKNGLTYASGSEDLYYLHIDDEMKRELIKHPGQEAGAKAILKALSEAKKISYDRYVDQVSADYYWLYLRDSRIKISEDELARVKKDKFKALYIPEIDVKDLTSDLSDLLRKVKVRP